MFACSRDSPVSLETHSPDFFDDPIIPKGCRQLSPEYKGEEEEEEDDLGLGENQDIMPLLPPS
jgi:hypothetical protein